MLIRRFVRILREFGFDAPKFVGAIRGLPRFFLTYINWTFLNKRIQLNLSPAVQDFYDESGNARGHYFWQDLICAKWINSDKPETHLDLGSRIDGFVAHLLSFMDVEVLDIRPQATDIPGLTTRVINAQEGLDPFFQRYPSASSLHSLEHFGLGRYGDPLDVHGHEKGLENLSRTLNVGGTLYVSFPIGKPRVEFNSQRILDPKWPQVALTNFELIEFVLIPWSGPPQFGLTPNEVNLSIDGQCGLYKFKKIA